MLHQFPFSFSPRPSQCCTHTFSTIFPTSICRLLTHPTPARHISGIEIMMAKRQVLFPYFFSSPVPRRVLKTPENTEKTAKKYVEIMMREFRNYSTYSLQLFYIRIAIIPHKRVTFWTFLFLSCRKYIHTKQPAFDRIKEEDLILFLSYFLAFVLVFICEASHS